MVGADAAADAVRRARRLPSLRVGLHLVVIEGRATLPAARIPDLVDPRTNRFPSDQLRLGIDYFFRPRVRQQLAAEIRAQFEAFRATGLALDHANAHKHMHLHPTVGAMLIGTGRDYGLRAVRVPFEPTLEPGSLVGDLGARALGAWTTVLRRQVERAGMRTTDRCYGLAWSGAMTTPRVHALLTSLPPGDSEIYFHPAACRDAALTRLMPDYRHEDELAALVDPGTRALLAGRGTVWDAVRPFRNEPWGNGAP